MAKHPQPQDQAAQTGLEATPVASEPIKFDEPISAADQVAAVSDSPQEQLISEKQLQALHAAAAREDTKRDFTKKVLAARAKSEEPEPAPPQVASGVLAQTQAEMAAGAKMNEHHASLQTRRPPAPVEGTTTAIFRPGDYVPDQKKGQGQVQSRNM